AIDRDEQGSKANRLDPLDESHPELDVHPHIELEPEVAARCFVYLFHRGQRLGGHGARHAHPRRRLRQRHLSAFGHEACRGRRRNGERHRDLLAENLDSGRALRNVLQDPVLDLERPVRIAVVLAGYSIFRSAVDVFEYGARQTLLCHLPEVLDVVGTEIAAFHAGLPFPHYLKFDPVQALTRRGWWLVDGG